ncbi:4-nitrophenyl phosphatase [Alkalibacterium putridalgicola]|uniref:Acid sugar phosphatase n=1 Tax=Alkalibacterium putridalgicola TaxID=426703 RepID=A0A1H7TPH2_9LACT|nr:haloacid dehalogenase [Alkalibacterium putridalgicola]SEL86593.1 4-nitrophenyl phosphatase [Alkalibacterium putridalgicola]
MQDIKYRGYFIDLDGTMYKGTEPIKEAPYFVKKLKNSKIPYLFLTNNSTSTPEEVADRLNKTFNIPAKAENIYTSALATADYVKALKGNRVYVVGEDGLRQALTDVGCELVDEDIDHVVVGLDRHLTYDKCEVASLAIQKGATFVATNKDTNIPTERGMSPGAGSVIAMIERASHTKPIFVGKPEKIMMASALDKLNLSKKEVLMVGDNYETDIMAGINSQIDTLLVLTGFTKKEDLEYLEIQPTYVINTLDEWGDDRA